MAAATGDLTAASAAGWTRASSGGTVTYTRAFAAGAGGAAAAGAQSALQALVFQPARTRSRWAAPRPTASPSPRRTRRAPASSTLAGSDTVTPVHDVPVLAGTVGGQSVPDVGAAQPFAATTLSDPDLTPLVLIVTESAASGDLDRRLHRRLHPLRLRHARQLHRDLRRRRPRAGTPRRPRRRRCRGWCSARSAHANPPGSTEADLFSASVSDGQGGGATTATGTVTVTARTTCRRCRARSAASRSPTRARRTPFSGRGGDGAGRHVADPDGDRRRGDRRPRRRLDRRLDARCRRRHRHLHAGVRGRHRRRGGGAGGAAGLVFQPIGACPRHRRHGDGRLLRDRDGRQRRRLAPPWPARTPSAPCTTPPWWPGASPARPPPPARRSCPFGGVTVSDPDRVGLLASVTVQGGAAGRATSRRRTAGWTRSVQGADTVFTRAFACAGRGRGGAGRHRRAGLHARAARRGRASPCRSRTRRRRRSPRRRTPLPPCRWSRAAPPSPAAAARRPSPTPRRWRRWPASRWLDAGLAPALASVTVSGAARSGDDLTAASAAGWTRGVSGTDVVYTRSFAAGPGEQAALQSALARWCCSPPRTPRRPAACTRRRCCSRCRTPSAPHGREHRSRSPPRPTPRRWSAPRPT